MQKIEIVNKNEMIEQISKKINDILIYEKYILSFNVRATIEDDNSKTKRINIDIDLKSIIEQITPPYFGGAIPNIV